MTRKQIALKLDAYSPLHNFSAETGPTSYKRYTKAELLAICNMLKITVNP